jgi:hypothetical protein
MYASPFALQVILLVLWFTVFPTMPLWLVFLPAIISGVVLFIALVILLVVVLAASTK